MNFHTASQLRYLRKKELLSVEVFIPTQTGAQRFPKTRSIACRRK